MRNAVFSSLLTRRSSGKGKAAAHPSYGATSGSLERVPEDEDDDVQVEWPPAGLEEDETTGLEVWDSGMCCTISAAVYWI